MKVILELTEELTISGFNWITNRIELNETNEESFEKKHYVAASREMKTGIAFAERLRIFFPSVKKHLFAPM